MSVVFGGFKLMLGMEPARRVGSSPGTPTTLLVRSDGREQRHAWAVTGLVWPRWIQFHWFLHILWCIHLPCIVAVPVVLPVSVCGLCARGPLGTGVFCATGTISLPLTRLLLVGCTPPRCSLGLHRCPLTPRRPAARLAALALLPATQVGCQRA